MGCKGCFDLEVEGNHEIEWKGGIIMRQTRRDDLFLRWKGIMRQSGKVKQKGFALEVVVIDVNH